MYMAVCTEAPTRGLTPHSDLLGTEFDPWNIPRGIGSGRIGNGKGFFPRTSVFIPSSIPRIIPLTDVL
jgi:hypothetical protein